MTIPLASIAPELQAPLKRLPPVPFGSRIGRWFIRRSLGLMPAADLGDVKRGTIEADGARLRVYHPPEQRSAAALFWIHGGGFLIGTAALDDRACAEVARDLGILVVSAEYRLSPEHPFPLPLDDCLAGWRWLRANADRFGIDPARIAIGGQSAGGALAAALTQRVHDLGEPAAAQWLFCPMLDDRTAADATLDKIGHRLWSNRNNRIGWRAYLGQAPGAADLPAYAVPARRVELAGLPPAWIGVGDIDLFHAEDAAYAQRLRAAGVATALDVVPAAPHGFEAWAFDTDIARSFRARARVWLRDTLNA